MNWFRNWSIYGEDSNQFTAYKNNGATLMNEWSLYDWVEHKWYYLSTLEQCKEVAESLVAKRSVKIMDWIKVDAEHMPPDGELVIVTIQNDDGKRCVLADNRWDSLNNRWEWLCEASAGYWETLHDEVTHWMPYPAPAQD